MNYLFSKKFTKQYKKLDQKIKNNLSQRLKLFEENPYQPMLSNHKLAGDFQGYRSINITGNYRLVYKEIDKTTVYLVAIGTHSQLYG